MSKKTSADLQALCIKAMEQQIQQLRQAEGPDTKLEKNLKRQLQEVKAVDTEKADRRALKYFGN